MEKEIIVLAALDSNILVRLENEKFMKNEMAITHLIFEISKWE
jgi:hypothetical protein